MLSKKTIYIGCGIFVIVVSAIIAFFVVDGGNDDTSTTASKNTSGVSSSVKSSAQMTDREKALQRVREMKARALAQQKAQQEPSQ